MKISKGIDKDLLLSYIIIGVFVLVAVAASIYAYKATSVAEKPVSSELAVELGLRLALLPPDSGLTSAYDRAITDNKITQSEYDYLTRRAAAYRSEVVRQYAADNEQRKLLNDADPLTRAKHNLSAYDKVGSMIVPPHLKEKVREGLVQKIKDIEKAKESSKTP